MEKAPGGSVGMSRGQREHVSVTLKQLAHILVC